MMPTGKDSLNTRSTLTAGSKTYSYYSLEKAAAALGDISRLPFSMKVLLENLLRFEDGETVTEKDLKAMLRIPEMGEPGVRQFQGRPSGHRNLPPGQSRAYRRLRLDK